MPRHGSPTRRRRVAVALAVAAPLALSSAAQAAPTELITNGSFETGSFAPWTATQPASPLTPWSVANSSVFGYFRAASPPDGTRDALNGFDGGGPATYVLSQNVTIPAHTAATLTWKDRMEYAMTGGAAPRTHAVQVRSQSTGAVLGTVYSLSTGYGDNTCCSVPPGHDLGWQSHTVDLSSFVGQSVTLAFVDTIPENYTGPGQMEYDAISLKATALGPVNTGPASISGHLYQGKVLTADHGTWTGSGTVTYSYQWQRCLGSACTTIGGATGQSYTVTSDDVGKRLQVIVTATDSGGSASVTSAPTGVVSKYSDVVGADAPIAYWRLGDAYDQAAMTDSSGHGHHGEYKNGATGTAGAPVPSVGVSGDGDTTAIFTGNGTYGYVNGITAPKDGYSFEAWIKPSDSDKAMIFEQGGAGAIYIEGDRIVFRQSDNFADSAVVSSTTVSSLDPATFHQVVATWDGTTAKLYVDGALAGSLASDKPVSGAGTVYVGYGQLGPWFRGYIDEAAYYDKALSAAQVLTHFNADPPPLLVPGHARSASNATYAHPAPAGTDAPAATAPDTAPAAAPAVAAVVTPAAVAPAKAAATTVAKATKQVSARAKRLAKLRAERKARAKRLAKLRAAKRKAAAAKQRHH